ncbi:uncharacterized protein METZ01_LOCUS85122 [marine metagenome]|uniref:Uncharacterized protein n=1 Tax=marine metagenome TaxID=408172 RepID=A0A381UXD3_9ZZZZ
MPMRQLLGRKAVAMSLISMAPPRLLRLQLEIPAIPVLRARKALQVKLVRRALLALQVLQVLLAPLALLVLTARLVLTAPLAPLVPLVQLALLVLTARLALTGTTQGP